MWEDIYLMGSLRPVNHKSQANVNKKNKNVGRVILPQPHASFTWFPDMTRGCLGVKNQFSIYPSLMLLWPYSRESTLVCMHSSSSGFSGRLRSPLLCILFSLRVGCQHRCCCFFSSEKQQSTHWNLSTVLPGKDCPHCVHQGHKTVLGSGVISGSWTSLWASDDRADKMGWGGNKLSTHAHTLHKHSGVLQIQK